MSRSSARKKARRQEAARVRAAHDTLARCLDFGYVFSIGALLEAEAACRRGVMWKDSVINFDKRRGPACALLAFELASGKYEKRPPRPCRNRAAMVALFPAMRAKRDW